MVNNSRGVKASKSRHSPFFITLSLFVSIDLFKGVPTYTLANKPE